MKDQIILLELVVLTRVTFRFNLNILDTTHGDNSSVF